jgi:hypothetical protein
MCLLNISPKEFFPKESFCLKDKYRMSIPEEVHRRQQQVDRLDTKVIELSQDLVRNEVRSHEALINNEFFLKMSDPFFTKLTVQEQMMTLALWSCERNWSVPENKFSFECRKKIDGLTVDFAVYLNSGNRIYKAAINFGDSEGKRRSLEALGFSALNFPASDVGQRPLEVAEEVFNFLDTQADHRTMNGHNGTNGNSR